MLSELTTIAIVALGALALFSTDKSAALFAIGAAVLAMAPMASGFFV